MNQPLWRGAGVGRPAAPVRILHVGLGNFFRAHQAWYTEHAPDAAEWGIAAFTGRSHRMADALAPQDGLYTLITRAASGDSYEAISSISAVHAATDDLAYLEYWRSPNLALVTVTVTEAGYVLAPDGSLDLADPALAADLAALRRGATTGLATTPGRLVAGLTARRAAGAGPIALVSCDNLSGNGAVLRRVLTDFADRVAPGLAGWVDANAGFVSTMVDRITPATTPDDLDAVRSATGFDDAVPVPTEPFTEWVLAGDFPAGRPAWEAVGARFVPDATPYEERKLTLLNGSHSLLAYCGSVLGHETVAEAIADPRCLAWVEQWWDEACRHLDLPATELAAHRQALLERYRNPAIRHSLAQIASDGSLKLPVRILPTLRAEYAGGRTPSAAARVLAAWVLHLRGRGAPVRDAGGAAVLAVASGGLGDSVDAALAVLGLDQPGLREAVVDAATHLMADAPG